MGLNKALRYFELALLEDPNYALAYSGLADTHFLLGFYGYAPPAEFVPKAKAAAKRALEIDPTLPEAHLSFAANNSWYEWDFKAGEQAYKRAMELNPNYALAHSWYASLLSGLGRHSEAITAAARATEIDPLSPYTHTLLGWSLVFARQYADAVEPLRKALSLVPDYVLAHWMLGQAYVGQSQFADGIAELAKAAELSAGAGWVGGFLLHAYAASGQREKAASLLATLRDPAKQPPVSPFILAIGEASLGNRERAFEWLEKAFIDHDMWLTWLKCLYPFDGLRADPRFAELLRKIGLEN